MMNQDTIIGICAFIGARASNQIMPENHVEPENLFELPKTVDGLIVEKQT